MEWDGKYLDRLTHIQARHRHKKVRPRRAKRCFDFTPYFLLLILYFCHTLSHTFGCSCDNMFNTCIRAPYFLIHHSFAHERVSLTLLISTGRPDLEAVIMGSSPLACLRCCAAPVMSYTPKQQQSHQSKHTTQQMFKTHINQQATASIKIIRWHNNNNKKRSTVYLHLLGAQRCTQKSLSP